MKLFVAGKCLPAGNATMAGCATTNDDLNSQKIMNDQKSQPSQRNAEVIGSQNFVMTGDGNIVYTAPPERSAKHQLRAPVGDFVGREVEIAELTAELTNGGQVGISGIKRFGFKL